VTAHSLVESKTQDLIIIRLIIINFASAKF